MWELGFNLYCANRLDEAEASWRKAEDLNPKYAGGHALWAIGQVLMGRNTEALATVERESDEAWRLSALPVVYWSVGRRAESDAALNELKEKYAAGSAYQIAEMHAYRGETDSAVQWLDRAYRLHDVGITWVRVDPLLQNLHKDQRYKAVLVKMKLDGDPPAALH
jgi:tetratricopeptide (TPR) repeat protein